MLYEIARNFIYEEKFSSSLIMKAIGLRISAVK
jgi:hypothetical protein